jgi:cell division septal protein FtsQ
VSKRIHPNTPPLAQPVRRLLLRPRVWAGLLFLLGLGFGAHSLWQRGAPTVARHRQYQITAEGIHITPPPPWIRTDLKSQVLRDAGLTTLSVLDDWDTLSRRIKDAFEFHPWVASVERISKRLPAALEIELKYRRPVAAVESGDSSGVSFLPVDEHAVRLPEGDLTDAERRYLPPL